jgi:hypothetical protein
MPSVCLINFRINLVYIDAALNKLRPEGYPVKDEDVHRLSPLLHEHINMLGRYSFLMSDAVAKGELRPLRNSEDGKLVRWQSGLTTWSLLNYNDLHGAKRAFWSTFRASSKPFTLQKKNGLRCAECKTLVCSVRINSIRRRLHAGLLRLYTYAVEARVWSKRRRDFGVDKLAESDVFENHTFEYRLQRRMWVGHRLFLLPPPHIGVIIFPTLGPGRMMETCTTRS